MNQKRLKQRISNFLTGEYFTDALRITLSIITPAGVLFALGLAQPAIGVTLGALLIALTDLRGTIEDKRTTTTVSILLFFLVSLISIAALPYPWLMGAVFFLITLGCSMLTAYGSRLSMAGTAAIVLMIFIWGLNPTDYWFCLYLLMGGLWYYAISLLHLWLWPERYLRYAISEALLTTHNYLQVKALFYDTDLTLKDCYNQAILSHTRVSEAQQQLRSILLRDKAVMHQDNRTGQVLLHVAEKTIDLYEQITAIHYDYDFIRNQFAITGALDLIQQMIRLLAADMLHVSEMKPFSTRPQQGTQTDRQLTQLTARFEYLIKKENDSNAAILSQLLANLKSIYADIQEIDHTLRNETNVIIPAKTQVEYQHFAPFEKLEWKQLVSHFKISSPIFRFSLRLAVTCLFCYLLAQVFVLGKYSYWILITVVVIIKPAFSLTRQRNIQRLTGTLLGIVLALVLLYFVTNTAILLVFAAVFLLVYFTFNRTHHLVSVIALTPMVISIVYLYGNSGWGFVLERIYDTLIGCAIAFGATYLFPSWESSRMLFLCRELLKSNLHYLEKLDDALSGKPMNVTAYKLARKSVYLGQANLSQSFQRMLREPGNKAIVSEYMYHFQMLNHMLSAHIASLFRSLSMQDNADPFADRNRVKAVRDVLFQSLLLLDPSPREATPDDSENRLSESLHLSPEEYKDPFFSLKTIGGQIRLCCLELRTVLA
ncbi:hypothetical protein BWI93_12105 [Siphonobacter sp. BAB-5385]|uniref:FUSC family membrane protein n=1 Tax=Siphonobacter sp. BAB-5385 TaxID=1864822 RepID=UPI000B9E6A40|nr:FUSC family membrane protein [Siphonobacter sp. BAB-5385]OZI07882.1 hypothetical protein BWI93_12105 [Siphonobacter sp. BAB-5385]